MGSSYNLHLTPGKSVMSVGISRLEHGAYHFTIHSGSGESISLYFQDEVAAVESLIKVQTSIEEFLESVGGIDDYYSSVK